MVRCQPFLPGADPAATGTPGTRTEKGARCRAISNRDGTLVDPLEILAQMVGLQPLASETLDAEVE